MQTLKSVVKVLHFVQPSSTPNTSLQVWRLHFSLQRNLRKAIEFYIHVISMRQGCIQIRRQCALNICKWHLNLCGSALSFLY